MSEKKVIDIKEINFDNSKVNRGFLDKFINSADVENLLINNIPQVQSAWFRFQSEWAYNAYQSMKDLDKYLILAYLIQKTFIHYADLMVIISEETMYAQDTFEIDKVNLIEISEELGIPKETVRRKINELSKEGIVERLGKRIILKVNAFQKQRPVKTVKTLSSFLAICSNLISSESNLLPSVPKENIESFIRTNFTLIWRFYFKTQIPTMIDWRKYYGDLETWVVTGVVLINQSLKLRDLFKGKGITLDLNTMTNEDKFKSVYEFIFSNSDKIQVQHIKFENYEGFIGRVLLYNDIVRQSELCTKYNCKLSCFRPDGSKDYGGDVNLCIKDCNKSCNDIEKCQKICIDCEVEEEDWDLQTKLRLCPWLKDIKKLDKSAPDAPKIRGFPGDGKILIEWKKPFNGRGKISNYIIMVYETFNKKNGIQVNISSNPQCEICEHEIKNLKNQVYYDIMVKAVNNVGIGKSSNIVTMAPNGEKLKNEKNNIFYELDYELDQNISPDEIDVACDSTNFENTQRHALDNNVFNFDNYIRTN